MAMALLAYTAKVIYRLYRVESRSVIHLSRSRASHNLLQWLKRTAELYAQVKERVAEGRFEWSGAR